MLIRQIKLEDLKHACQWWYNHYGSGLPDQLLSAFGFIAEDETGPLAVLFWYPTLGSKMAWCGWPITNTCRQKKECSRAVNLLHDKIAEEAKAYGYTLLWTASNIPLYKVRLEELGYKRGDTRMDHFTKEL